MYKLLCCLLAISSGGSATAWATPMLFINDAQGFGAATHGLVFNSEGFELTDQQWAERCGAVDPAACAPSNRYAESMRFGQVVVSTGEGEHFRIETAYKNNGDFVSEGLSSISAAPGGYQDWGAVTFRFDTAVNAIQFDLLDVASSVGDTVLTFYTDSGFQSLLFHLPGSDANEGRLDVIGFYDPTESFTAFTLGFDCSLAAGAGCADDDLVGVDALRYAAVPEPDLRLLMFAGLLMLPWGMRYRRCNAET